MSESLGQIGRRPLPDELADRLRTLIVEGALAPGAKVIEPELCTRFGVSRTPLREALRSLAVEGLVVLTPRRGARIAEVTREDLEEAFPIVGALEALAGELACKTIANAEIARARALQARLVAEREAADLKGYSATNAAVHALILKAAANPTLETLLQTLNARVRRARVMANLSEARWSSAVAEHAEITEALSARDGAALAAVLKRHLANTMDAMCERLERRAP